MIAIPNMDMPETCDMCPIEGCEYINGKFTCPLIDIVTCGECKWSYTDERDGLLWCKVHLHHYRVNTDDFCSYGERELFGISERLEGEANDSI